MPTLYLRESDRLEGASNFTPWKYKLQMLLEEVELWEHVDKEITTPTDPKQLVEYYKEEAKEKIIILNLVKDHLFTHNEKKKIGKVMYDVFIALYKTVNIFRKMLLRNNISTIIMRDTNLVVS